MATERQIQEMIARCVSIAVFYHNGEMTPKTRASRASEFRTVAAELKRWGLSRGAMEGRILRPLEAELIARYGTEAGRGHYVEVLKGFEEPAVPLLCPAAR
jgi:hypothetical protein